MIKRFLSCKDNTITVLTLLLNTIQIRINSYTIEKILSNQK